MALFFLLLLFFSWKTTHPKGSLKPHSGTCEEVEARERGNTRVRRRERERERIKAIDLVFFGVSLRRRLGSPTAPLNRALFRLRASAQGDAGFDALSLVPLLRQKICCSTRTGCPLPAASRRGRDRRRRDHCLSSRPRRGRPWPPRGRTPRRRPPRPHRWPGQSPCGAAGGTRLVLPSLSFEGKEEK